MQPSDLTLRDWLDVLAGSRRCLLCQPHDYADANTLCEHVTARGLVPDPAVVGAAALPTHRGAPGNCTQEVGFMSGDKEINSCVSRHPTREGARAEWQRTWVIGHALAALFSTLSEWAREGAQERARQAGWTKVPTGQFYESQSDFMAAWGEAMRGLSDGIGFRFTMDNAIAGLDELIPSHQPGTDLPPGALEPMRFRCVPVFPEPPNVDVPTRCEMVPIIVGPSCDHLGKTICRHDDGGYVCSNCGEVVFDSSGVPTPQARDRWDTLPPESQVGTVVRTGGTLLDPLFEIRPGSRLRYWGRS